MQDYSKITIKQKRSHTSNRVKILQAIHDLVGQISSNYEGIMCTNNYYSCTLSLINLAKWSTYFSRGNFIDRLKSWLKQWSSAQRVLIDLSANKITLRPSKLTWGYRPVFQGWSQCTINRNFSASRNFVIKHTCSRRTSLGYINGLNY